MPSGLCWCLGGPRPPEIKHTLDLAAPLQPVSVDIPMPTDENELNAKFEELVAELGLDKTHRDALYSLPAEKKWQIYCSKKMDVGTSKQNGAEFYIEKMGIINTNLSSMSEEDCASASNLVENLKTALRTQTLSFVLAFIEQNGLQCLLDFLSKMDYETSEGPLHTAVIGCIKALLNNSQGRAHVLAHPDCINTIAQSLAVENVKTKIAVLEILGAICLVPGGHRKVLNAMLHFQKYAGERTRFQLLICDLDKTTGKYRDEVALKTAIMSFINAALKYGAGQDHLEFRLHLRYELLMLGIVPIMKKMRSHGNTTLDRHLDFFEMVRNEDEKEFAKRFDGAHIDSKSATSMFDVLRKKLHLSTAYPNLLSILQHMLLIPYGKNDVLQVWTLLDKVVQQMVLQLKKGEDPDGAPLEEINVKQLIRQLASETDIKSYQTKLREAEKASDELNAKLAKKERECEVRMEEKEDLLSTMNMMKTKLETEVAAHAETRQQLQELLSRVEEIRSQLDTERGEKQKLQHLVQSGSLPDDAKVGLSTAASALISNIEGKLRDAPPLGPPPPPPGMPPPPPPPAPGAPPMLSKFGVNGISSGISAKLKGNPKPSVPMKSFNWTKLPENEISGTVWSDINHSKIYSSLDLEEFQRTFSAYQKPATDEGDEDHKNMNKAKTQVLTVIDGRRSQNCTILLSKLKLTNEELSRAIMNVDEGEDLPKDMVEQLLKFVPTAEEIQLLSEYAHEIENMARADRFLYEMSKIVHYEERLKALYFKKKYQERRVDCKQKIDAISECSKEVMRSKKLRKLLELVLAFGNFMNKGQRGQALGFKLASLSKMMDTKGSVNKNMTLLHYTVEVAEKKFPEVLKLGDDLSHIHDAAKVNFTDLDKEITNLRKGLQNIEKEVQFFEKKMESCFGQDKFVSVMKDFCTVAAYNFSSVEDSCQEMKQKYEKTLKAFCEDPKQVQPEEFFGSINNFVTAMNDAKCENEKFKKQKEEEEKRKVLEDQLKKEREKRSLLRRASSTDKSKAIITTVENGDKGEFDDLISALRTGDVFGEDMAKLAKRNRRRVNNGADFSRERQGSKASLT